MQPPENPYGSNPSGPGGQPNPGGPFGQPAQPGQPGAYGQPAPAGPYGQPGQVPPGYGPPPGGSPYGPPPQYGGRYAGPPGYRPMAPQGGQPRGTVSYDVIGESWELIKPNIGIWILALIIVIAIGMVTGFVSNLITLPLAPAKGSSLSAAMPFLVVTFILSVIRFAINAFLTAGMTRMAIQHVRTGTPDISQMFSVTDVLATTIISSILVSICTFVGFLLLIIPGIIAGLGLSMTQQLVVDRKLSATEAIGKSWEGVKPHLGAMFVLGILLSLVNFVGALACCVGLLVTLPMTQIAMALVYRDLFGLNVPDYPGAGLPPGAQPGGAYPGSGYQPPIPRP